MDKVQRTSTNPLSGRIDELKKLFPEAFPAGQLDFSALRGLLGDEAATSQDRYNFTWAGKQDALLSIQKPSRATLKPVRDESVDFDTTHNLFIEGENLEALKLLYKSYFGQVKMIYIDPPYNTGNDFVYPDNYTEPLENYLRMTGQVDEDGNPLTSKTEVNGRRHSRWLSMMYPRLFLARQLLCQDGVIFVSIDDREVHNLRLLMNEVFGEENYLTTFVWLNEGNIDNQSRFKRNHEYVLMYARDETQVLHPSVIDPNVPESSKLYRPHIENTIVKNGPANPISDISIPAGFPASFESGVIEPKEKFYPLISEPIYVAGYKTQNEVVVRSGWSSKDLFEQFIAGGFEPIVDAKGQEATFYFTETGAVYVRKERLSNQSHVLTVLTGMGTVQGESRNLSELGVYFDYPKPTELMKYLVRIGANDGDIVLDFFAGSGGVAQAVLELNRSEQTKRRFILIQLPEKTLESSPAKKADFDTVSQIGIERVKRLCKRLIQEKEGRLDIDNEDLGFRVYRLAQSTLHQWPEMSSDTTTSEQWTEQMRLIAEEPLVEGWRAEDVVTEVALKEAGFGLDYRVEKVDSVPEQEVWKIVDDVKGQIFYICLDDKLLLENLRPLSLHPEDLFIFRDTAANDTTIANLSLQCRVKTI